ncbi:hypothetical protein [Leptospira ryugenii]|uniref:hypothetical protein n=1 Tax=Leptospira ryugenii TaxID=1917863 RepID=UPI001AE87BEC|nr:hypothetical protein [Leptospira ryugenii]
MDAKSIRECIDANKAITFRKYGPSSEFDEELILVCNELCDYFHLEDFGSLFYTMVKDLVLNGFKANFKRVFFLENHLDIDSPADYELGVRMYKSFILAGKSKTYTDIAAGKNFWVNTEFSFDQDEIRVIVANNQSLTPAEMSKIKHSLVHAQNYNDIMEYYIERGDHSEGEGIGIALIVILMKGNGIPTTNFKIQSIKGETIASVKIPIKKN